MIRLNGVYKSFDGGASFAVHELDLDVAEGETVVLLGSSGCGKTTTLKMVNRLIEPSGGRVEVGGRDTVDVEILELRRSIGYVFQDIGLFPHMTVAQNVEVVPKLLGWPARGRRDRTSELLDVVGLSPTEFASRSPNQLSGGQQQRVGLARALAADPDYLLMDEPFGALDAVTREQLQSEIIRIKQQLNKTILFVTHDLFEAFRLGDRIAVMSRGRLEQFGSPDELRTRPKTPFVKELIGHARSQAQMFAGGSS